jgi:hypothetical protein
MFNISETSPVFSLQEFFTDVQTDIIGYANVQLTLPIQTTNNKEYYTYDVF